MIKWLFCFVSVACAFSDCIAQKTLTEKSLKRPDNFRFIYNTDGMNMFTDVEPPMKPETLHPYVDEVASTGATSLFISPNIGMVMNYPSATVGMIGENISAELAARIKPDAKAGSLERGIINIRSLVKAGYDPMKIIIDRAREKKMEVFISFRVNEVHSVEQTDDLLLSAFWKQHPEWRIGNFGDTVAQVYRDIMGPNTSPIVTKWLPAGLNFAIPEVRRFQLEIIRELCERYTVDGIEIDFQRFPMYFRNGGERTNTATMTQWLREIKKMIVDVTKNKPGKPMLVCRVMATPEQNTAIGLDPVTWSNEKIIDFLTVSHYLHNDFPLPVSEFRKILPQGFPVYASIEVSQDMNTYRNIASYLWQQEINGVYLFNFFTARERKNDPPFKEIRQIADPSTLNKILSEDSLNRPGQPLLLVANKHSNTLSFVNPLTLEVVQTIPTGPNPHEITVTPDQRFAYLSSYEPPGNTISVIDLVNRKLVKQISTGKYGRIHGAAMAPDGRNAYFTAAQSGCLVEIDTKTNEMTRTIETYGKTSHMVYVSADGKTLYTGNISSADVSVIDRVSGKLITKIPCGKGCGGMAFTPDGKYLWATNETDGTITIIDPHLKKPLETFKCNGIIKRIKFTADGKRALITSWTKDGEVIVLDADARKEIRRIKTGSHTIGIEISPDGNLAFAGCEDAKEAVMLPDGTERIKIKTEDSDGVHVIDLRKLAVLSIIRTGLGPDPMIIWTPPQTKNK